MLHPLPNILFGDIPQRFTYPFHYEAHPLCLLAANKLQEQLKEWKWDDTTQGKMFGVLIVQDADGQLGCLWAYSGNLTSNLNADSFVPPIFDLLDKTSFFIAGEKEISCINKAITKREQSAIFILAKAKVKTIKDEMKAVLSTQKQHNQAAKLLRQAKRTEGEGTLSAESLNCLNALLIKESQREKSALKQLKQNWSTQVELAEQDLSLLQQEIKTLQQQRIAKSTALQQQLFDEYQLLNAHGDIKNICTIFQENIGKLPPAAAGDCAAPRLLQHAYRKHLKPVAMAEFWWGKSPQTIIRKQGHYYPACRSKCEPILAHMLKGLDVDPNPLFDRLTPTIEIIHEEEEFLVLNKPSGILSVKGKTSQLCVLDQLREIRPEISAPIVVHRLDMPTSGLLIIAKNDKTYKALQAQFLSRQVKKRYDAILEGNIKSEGGKISLPLRVDLDNRPQQMVCPTHGKSALTVWKILDRTDGKTRVAFYPITGRTHQLRVHAAHPDGLNTAIVGDELYGTKAERLLLHAAQIEFTHPTTNQKLRFNAPTPF